MEDVWAGHSVDVSWLFSMEGGSLDRATLHFISDLPDHSAQLSCDGDFDFVVMHQAFAQGGKAKIEPVLGRPRDLTNRSRESLLANGEVGSHSWFFAVVGGAFDHDPARMAVTAFGDTSALGFASGGVFAGGEAEVAHELFGMGEADEVADFGYDHHGGNHLKAFEAHDGVDDGFATPVGVEAFHVIFVAGDAFVELIDLADEFFEDDAVGRKWQGEIAEVAFVGIGPGGLAGIVEAKATQESEETGFGAAAIIDGIDAGAAEVADGFVSFVRNEDGNEFSGAKKPG